MNKNLFGVLTENAVLGCLVLLAITGPLFLSEVTTQTTVPPRPGLKADVIIAKDGVRRGQLSGCIADNCRIDNFSIARAGIVWIGLKSDVFSIPAPQDRLRDEVHYRDGSVHPGRLVGINADTVITERGSHPRAAVAWVYLTPRRQRAAPGQIGAPLPTPTPTPSRTPAPSPTPTQSPTSNETPTTQPPAGKRGGLWTGKITQRWIQRHPGGGVLRITTVIDDVRLREFIQPMNVFESGKLRQVGTITSLFPEGGKINDRVRDLSNVGGNGAGSYCTDVGEGTRPLTGADLSASYIWKKNGNVDTTTGVGWNVPSGPGLYHVGIAIHTLGGYTTTRTCVSGNGTDVSTEEREFQGMYLGRIPPDTEPVDPELRYLDNTGNRMIGSYTNTRITGGDGSVSVAWSICQEGVTCAAAPTAGDGAISLGNLFETDLADLLADAQVKLDGALSKMQTDPGLMPEIRVIVKLGGDPIFIESLAKAQIDALKAWFAERGIDASRISWTWETGASDQVMITY